MRLWLLEFLLRNQAWRVYRPAPPDGEMLRFYRLVAITLALESVAFLYLSGALRPLSAL